MARRPPDEPVERLAKALHRDGAKVPTVRSATASVGRRSCLVHALLAHLPGRSATPLPSRSRRETLTTEGAQRDLGWIARLDEIDRRAHSPDERQRSTGHKPSSI